MSDETETPAEKAPVKRSPRAQVAAAREEPKLNIFQLISKISTEAGALAPENKGGVPFAFRGVDQVVSHLSPLLRRYGVVVIPEVISNEVTSRELSAAKAITQSSITTKFTFYAPDGSSVSATTIGLAQDYADRSAAQAQSVAFRIALLQVFTLPTTDKEPEQNGEETQAYIAKAAAEAQAQRAAAAPATPAGPTVSELKTAIAAEFKAQGLEATPKSIKDYGNKLFDVETNPARANWHTLPAKLQEVLNKLRAEGKAKLAAEAGANEQTGEVA